MRFIFTCGGTAGHIYPAVAVANLIKERQPDSEIIFVGAKGKMETELVPREGYEIKTVEITNFSRSRSFAGLKHNIKTVRNVVASRKEARRILKEFKPVAVIGTGGYASYPILREAAREGIPTAVHESNAAPGLTTRVLSGVVDRVMVAFEDSRSRYKDPDKVVVTGTPVRSEFINADKAAAKKALGREDKPLVLSFWGSLGAQVMNGRMEEFIAMEQADGSFYHVHATGKGKLEKLVTGVEEQGADVGDIPTLELREYIFDMPLLMAAADLVLCRAGASTLAEIMACGTASILVPSPNVTDNHQEKNARVVEKGGAAKVMVESEFDAKQLYGAVAELLNDKTRLKEMGENARRLAVSDAAERIYDIIMEIVK